MRLPNYACRQTKGNFLAFKELAMTAKFRKNMFKLFENSAIYLTQSNRPAFRRYTLIDIRSHGFHSKLETLKIGLIQAQLN